MLEVMGDIAGIRRRIGAKQLSETTMSYSELIGIVQVKQAFGLTAVEGVRFLPSNVSRVSCERLGTCLLC
jgi:hypothetical protein